VTTATPGVEDLRERWLAARAEGIAEIDRIMAGPAAAYEQAIAQERALARAAPKEKIHLDPAVVTAWHLAAADARDAYERITGPARRALDRGPCGPTTAAAATPSNTAACFVTPW
jgi:hypothetical protein